MLTIFHSKVDDLARDEAFSLTGPPNPQRAALAARLFEAGKYEAVAEVDLLGSAAAFEAAWTMTQNGVMSDSWSREPPMGLRPLEPTVIIDRGRVYGRRSSMIGDIVEFREEGRVVSRHVADWIGFVPMECV